MFARSVSLIIHMLWFTTCQSKTDNGHKGAKYLMAILKDLLLDPNTGFIDLSQGSGFLLRNVIYMNKRGKTKRQEQYCVKKRFCSICFIGCVSYILQWCLNYFISYIRSLFLPTMHSDFYCTSDVH